MAEVNFSIESWSAWSKNKTERSNWVDWANGKDFTSTSNPPDISMVPPMKRRRLSSLTKMAFATAIDCIKDSHEVPICVFASQHGELTKTVKILNTLVDKDDVSPTDFSLSVNNTALGLFSIFSQNKKPATTIAAGEDTFGHALLEACVFMSRFPDSPVLLIYFDEPLPEPLSKLEQGIPEAFSIALLLTQKGKSEISMKFEYNDTGSGNGLNQGAEFLKFILGSDKSKESMTSRMTWSWNKLR